MHALNPFDRTLTDLDHVRLRTSCVATCASACPPSTTQQIEDTLDACAVVPARKVSPDVVTMYTQVLLLDRASGERSKVTLCYPADAQPADGFISVLSPLGWSLLGLRVGHVARWSTPTGGSGRPRCRPSCSSPRRAATTRCSRCLSTALAAHAATARPSNARDAAGAMALARAACSSPCNRFEERPMTPINTILVATDFSPDGNNAVWRAALLARELDAQLRLMHVVHTGGSSRCAIGSCGRSTSNCRPLPRVPRCASSAPRSRAAMT